MYKTGLLGNVQERSSRCFVAASLRCECWHQSELKLPVPASRAGFCHKALGSRWSAHQRSQCLLELWGW